MFRFLFYWNVSESGTQGRSGKRQQSEESCTGIRYAKRIREEVAIGRKMYRNPVRGAKPETGSDWKKVVPKSGTRRKIRKTATGRGTYRNSVRQGRSGISSDSDWKNVPEFGTHRKIQNGTKSIAVLGEKSARSNTNMQL